MEWYFKGTTIISGTSVFIHIFEPDNRIGSHKMHFFLIGQNYKQTTGIPAVVNSLSIPQIHLIISRRQSARRFWGNPQNCC